MADAENTRPTTFDPIDVDKRIDELMEMTWRVIRSDTMTRSEKVRELNRLADRALWWDARRELAHNLDVLADAAAAPGVER